MRRRLGHRQQQVDTAVRGGIAWAWGDGPATREQRRREKNDLSVTDRDRLTPLRLAERRGHKVLAWLLTTAASSPSAQYPGFLFMT